MRIHSHQADKGFKGAEISGGPRKGPVEFERPAEEADPFGLDAFLTDVKKVSGRRLRPGAAVHAAMWPGELPDLSHWQRGLARSCLTVHCLHPPGHTACPCHWAPPRRELVAAVAGWTGWGARGGCALPGGPATWRSRWRAGQGGACSSHRDAAECAAVWACAAVCVVAAWLCVVWCICLQGHALYMGSLRASVLSEASSCSSPGQQLPGFA